MSAHQLFITIILKEKKTYQHKLSKTNLSRLQRPLIMTLSHADEVCIYKFMRRGKLGNNKKQKQKNYLNGLFVLYAN